MEIDSIYNITNCNGKNIIIKKNNNNKKFFFVFIFININILSEINFVVSNFLLGCLFFFVYIN